MQAHGEVIPDPPPAGSVVVLRHVMRDPEEFADCSISSADVSRVSLDGRFRYARNYARGHPPQAETTPRQPSSQRKTPR